MIESETRPSAALKAGGIGCAVVVKKGIENTLDSDCCYPDGLEGIAEEPEKGAYRICRHWSLREVPKCQGTAVLCRLRDHLTGKEWRITQFGDDPRRHERTLEVERDGDIRSASPIDGMTSASMAAARPPVQRTPAGRSRKDAMKSLKSAGHRSWLLVRGTPWRRKTRVKHLTITNSHQYSSTVSGDGMFFARSPARMTGCPRRTGERRLSGDKPPFGTKSSADN